MGVAEHEYSCRIIADVMVCKVQGARWDRGGGAKFHKEHEGEGMRGGGDTAGRRDGDTLDTLVRAECRDRETDRERERERDTSEAP